MPNPRAIGFWALLLAGAPLLACGSALAGEVTASGGGLSLGTAVNGVVGGSCAAGLCQVSGGTAAGSNLFHRLSAFDTRGAITGVNVNTGGLPNVFMAVTNPAGSFIDKQVNFTGPTNLVWLSPGGISLSGAGGFANVQQLNLSTATGWRVGAGVFDAAGTTAGQAALLSGMPVQGLAGAVNDPAALNALGLQKNGDLSLAGGLLTVDQSLLLDAQGGNVLLQAAGVEARAGSVAIQGQSVLQAAPVAGASVAISAAGRVLNSAPIQASGTAGASGSITVQAGEAVVQTTSAVLDASRAGGAAAAGGPGGTISVQAGERLFSSATMRANGEGASGSGGTIEVTAPKVTLAAAQLEASGAAGGGAVRVGGGYQGRPLSLGGSNATSTSVNGSSTLKADATGRGDGGQVVVWAEGSTTYRGSASARGGAGGGNGGSIEVSGKEQLVYGGQADARAPQGTAGSLLLDPKNIRIDAAANTAGQVVYDVIGLESPFGGAGNGFAKDVVVLAGGNIVATDPYSDGFGTNSGGVYLFDGNTGGLLSALTGSQAGDQVGNDGITLLSNGNYVVNSVGWNSSAGAVTWGSGSSGVSGVVSSANSLIGSNPNDFVGGDGITALSNGNYVVRSSNWGSGGSSGSGLGAVTWGDGSSGVSGVVSSANSLIGSNSFDLVGNGGITELSNGNYVVSSGNWNSSAGAVTWGSGSSGVSGVVSSANSLIGSNPYDQVGIDGITALSNGNYVVRSTVWGSGGSYGSLLGAVTWGSGSSGVSGVVSSANSLIGSNPYDQVGFNGITELSNGNYVVSSSGWGSDGESFGQGFGAVTWGSGSSGVSGVVSSANSLIGSNPNDFVGGDGITALSNGNYVVRSSNWGSGGGGGITAFIISSGSGLGAVTWGDGSSGVSGVVSSANSLIGSNPGDSVGNDVITALSNGNYVVNSVGWNSSAGAVTWGSGSSGVSGVVSSVNSLIGSNSFDYVGDNGITALSNGNYVVNSVGWNSSAGAVTWGSGSSGVSGVVSSANSLIGTNSGDNVGIEGITALSNGNYVVSSPYWDSYTGAVTWGSGSSGVSGVVSSANSLIGTNPGDYVGDGITALSNGNYVVNSVGWNSSAGAVTWGSGSSGVSGVVSSANSLIGSNPNDFVGLNGITELSNGNYIVRSSYWNSYAGAVTWGSGSSGVSGVVSSANSLIGSNSFDLVGGDGITALSNGNYVVRSSNWGSGGSSGSGLGAVTWGDGSSGSSGVVSGSNSLQGGSAGAYVGATFLDLGGVGDRFLLNAPADLNGAGQLSLVGVNSSGFNGIWNFSTSPAAELLITPAQIAATASNGTNVILQANNDIILAEASTISIVPPSDGKPGDLTLQAGRSIRLDSPIETGGGNLLLVANDPDALAAYREGGLGGVMMAYGTSIDSADGAVTIRSLGGSAGLIDLQSISASALTVEGDGSIQWVGPGAQITVTNGPIQFLADTVGLQSGVIASNHAVEFKSGTSLSLSDIQFTGSGLVNLPSAGLTTVANGVAAQSLSITGGTLSGPGTLTVSQNFQRTGGIIDNTLSGVSITQASGDLTPGALSVGGPVSLTTLSGNLVVGDVVTASNTVTLLSSGDVNIGSGASISSTAAGDAIVVAAGGNFINLAGSAALSASIGRWLVYSTDPASDTRGGLAYDFKHYGQTYGSTAYAGPGLGNGFLYTTAPTITPGLTGSLTKTYDGNTPATLTAANYITSGAIDGDLVVLNNPAVGTYNSKNVLEANSVSVDGLSIASATDSAGNEVYGYTLTTDVLSATGSITPLTLSGVAIADGSSIYGSALAPGGVSFSNIIGADAVLSSASVNTGALSTSGNYVAGSYSQSAGTELIGADAGNYSFSGFSSATANYSINPLALTGAAIADGSSIYGSSLAPGAVSFGNIIGADAVLSSAAVNTSILSSSGNAVVGSYSQSASGLGGADAGNYSFSGFSSATPNYSINPLALSVAGVVANNKVYDGNSQVSFTTNAATFTGLLAGDVVGLTGSGLFADPNVGLAKSVAVSALALNGADAANYNLASGPTTLTADISIRPLSTWRGSTAGLWSDAANWDALPSGANVAAVAIPVGTGAVTYDADAGTTQLQSLINNQNLSLRGGSLTVSDATSVGVGAVLSLNGGVFSTASLLNQGLVNGSGTLLLNGLYSESGSGRLGTDFSSASITQSSGDLSLRTLGATGPISLTSAAGGLNLSGASLTSPGGTITLASAAPLSLQGSRIDASGGAAGGTVQLDGSSISIIGSSVNTSGAADGGTIRIGGRSLPSSVTISGSSLVADPPGLGGTISVDGASIAISSSSFNVFGLSGGTISLGSSSTASLSLDAFSSVIGGGGATFGLVASSISNSASFSGGVLTLNGQVPVVIKQPPATVPSLVTFQQSVNSLQPLQLATTIDYTAPLSQLVTQWEVRGLDLLALNLSESSFLYSDAYESSKTQQDDKQTDGQQAIPKPDQIKDEQKKRLEESLAKTGGNPALMTPLDNQADQMIQDRSIKGDSQQQAGGLVNQPVQQLSEQQASAQFTAAEQKAAQTTAEKLGLPAVSAGSVPTPAEMQQYLRQVIEALQRGSGK